MDFGTMIKFERESNKMLLREVAAFVKMDTALLSKIERNKRMATRDQVNLFIDLFSLDKQEIINLWLGQKIAYSLIDEDSPLQILKVAESAIHYLKQEPKWKL